jgi:hypothetical protein
MEVYKGVAADYAKGAVEDDQDILEFNLDEEVGDETSKLLAIAVLFSRKSFSPQYLFSDMLEAWNMQRLAVVEKVGDYIFRLKFNSAEEKNRVLDGDPWRHRGDALIVAHYDGLMRPSEIRIKCLGMWVHFYDLPPAMMHEAVTIQFGGQLGKYIRMDCRYLGYMRVRVDYPLDKPLIPQLTVKIKGRGQMPITLHYENVLHFYFICGHIGHTAMNYDDASEDDHEVKFGEELGMSSPRRVKEIMVCQIDTGVSRSLFPVAGMPTGDREPLQGSKPGMKGNTGSTHAREQTGQNPEDLTNAMAQDLACGVHDLHVVGNSPSACWASQRSRGKERVSFGTNMSTDEEYSDGARLKTNL